MTNSHHETTAFIEMADAAGPKLTQLPGLDGLRGVAVLAVVLYHMGFGWATGGYLGVSTFFTLSGFLITSILLNESIRAGRPSLGRFWSRRFRRLMPAALLTLLAVVVLFGRTVATADQRLGLRGDALGSLFYVANWRFVLAGSNYGDFTAAPSPVLHFWSLSIEEQFYVFFPLVMWALWRILRGRRGALVAALGALALVSWSLPVVLGLGTNRAYLGSDARAGEILVGGVLAVALSYRPVRRALALRYQFRVPLLALATVCAAVQIWWIISVEQTSQWLFRGGLGLFALMSCVLIAAAALPVGPFRFVLGTSVVRWLGTRSYGIYLFHWPLLIAARQMFPDTRNDLRAAAAVVEALVLAEASFRFVERPIRFGRWPAPQDALRFAVSGFVAVAVVASLPIPVDRRRLHTDFEAAEKKLDRLGETVAPPSTASTSTTVEPSPAPVPKVAIFGDSTSVLVALGLASSIKFGTTTDLAYVPGDAQVGCGVSRFGRHRLLDDAPLEPNCLEWPTRWAQAIAAAQPDISMIITGAWEVPDAQIPGSDRWASIGDPETDDFIRSELTEAVRTTSADGALTILWLWPAYASWADDLGRAAVARQHDPARMDRLHRIMEEVAEANPHTVRLFDMAAFLGPERLSDRSLRPDGLHISAEEMTKLFAEGLSETIDGIYLEWWRDQHR